MCFEQIKMTFWIYLVEENKFYRRWTLKQSTLITISEEHTPWGRDAVLPHWLPGLVSPDSVEAPASGLSEQHGRINPRVWAPNFVVVHLATYIQYCLFKDTTQWTGLTSGKTRHLPLKPELTFMNHAGDSLDSVARHNLWHDTGTLQRCLMNLWRHSFLRHLLTENMNLCPADSDSVTNWNIVCSFGLHIT